MPEHLNPIQVAADPVFCAFELPLRRTFFPLGYPLALETNSRDVILAAEEGWGASERMFNQDPVRVCLEWPKAIQNRRLQCQSSVQENI